MQTCRHTGYNLNTEQKRVNVPSRKSKTVGAGLNTAPYTRLEITAGQRTMSGLIVDLTGQTFVLPVMLTGQNSIVLKMK